MHLAHVLRELLPGIETTLVYRHDLLDIPDVKATIPINVQASRSPELKLLRTVGPVEKRQLAERGTRGDVCYVGYLDDGRPVHYAWVQRAGRHHIALGGVWCNVRATQAWIYDCYTVKWARGRGIYPEVLSLVLAGLKQSSVQECFIYARRSNAASIKGIERVGFRLTETLLSVRLGTRAVLIRRQS